MICVIEELEALAVNNGWAALVILLLGYPHLLEGGQRSKDGATDPYGVLPLSNTGVHGGASRHNCVCIQVLADVHVTLHDGIVNSFMNSTRFHSKEGRLEESLRATESLISNGDDLTIGQLIRLF